MASPPRILLIRYGAVGNTLMIVPLLRALRAKFPNGYIAVVTGRPGAGVLAGCPYLDDVIVYDPHGAERGIRPFIRLVRDLRHQDFSHALILKRSTRASGLPWLAGARHRVGFAGTGPLHTTQVAYVSGHPIADLYLEFGRLMGAQDKGAHLEVWPSGEDVRAVDKFLTQTGLTGPQPIVCFHPGGASHKERRWSEARYAEFARLCEEELEFRPLFIGGPEDEDVLERIAELSGGRYPISSCLSLPGSASLIGRCRLFVGGDSAPSHLAAAVGTPRIVLCGPSPKLPLALTAWTVQDSAGPPVRALRTGAFCLECSEYPCSFARMRECASTLTAQELLAEARALLQ